MPQFAEVVVEPQAGFVSPQQETPKIEPPPEEAAAGANQIISPSEAVTPTPRN
jgi:hypothetical protein